MLQGLFFDRIAPPKGVRRTIAPPALVIGHPNDPVHPFADSDELVRELPNARLLEAESILELRVRPARLTAEIAAFVDECWAAPAADRSVPERRARAPKRGTSARAAARKRPEHGGLTAGAAGGSVRQAREALVDQRVGRQERGGVPGDGQQERFAVQRIELGVGACDHGRRARHVSQQRDFADTLTTRAHGDLGAVDQDRQVARRDREVALAHLALAHDASCPPAPGRARPTAPASPAPAPAAP